MGVDGRITSGSRQVFVLTIWYVEVGLRVAVLFCQSKVDDIDLISTLSDSHQEVVRLDITVDEGFGMDVLNTRDELISE